METRGRAAQVEDLSIATADGRRLAARISGPAEGPLVLYFGGTPGALKLYEEGQLIEGERRGLRHLIYLRPGYSGSDRQPGRSVADCVGDAVAVLDAAGVERAYVVGHSGGGPHAAACAVLRPDRVRSAAVLSSFSPRGRTTWSEWLGDAGDRSRIEFDALESGSVTHREFLEREAEIMCEVRTRRQIQEVVGNLLGAADLAALEVPTFLAYQLRCYPLSVEGGIDGWFDDNEAAWRDWGFDLRHCAVPLTIWHGDDDRIVPYSHGVSLREQMPDAAFRRLEGEGHISYLVSSYGEILDELISQPGLGASAKRGL